MLKFRTNRMRPSREQSEQEEMKRGKKSSEIIVIREAAQNMKKSPSTINVSSTENSCANKRYTQNTHTPYAQKQQMVVYI